MRHEYNDNEPAGAQRSSAESMSDAHDLKTQHHDRTEPPEMMNQYSCAMFQNPDMSQRSDRVDPRTDTKKRRPNTVELHQGASNQRSAITQKYEITNQHLAMNNQRPDMTDQHDHASDMSYAIPAGSSRRRLLRPVRARHRAGEEQDAASGYRRLCAGAAAGGSR